MLLNGPRAPYPSSEVIDGWPVEYFVPTEDPRMRFCPLDRDRRRPATMRLPDGRNLGTGVGATCYQEP